MRKRCVTKHLLSVAGLYIYLEEPILPQTERSRGLLVGVNPRTAPIECSAVRRSSIKLRVFTDPELGRQHYATCSSNRTWSVVFIRQPHQKPEVPPGLQRHLHRHDPATYRSKKVYADIGHGSFPHTVSATTETYELRYRKMHIMSMG
jgi:hypothetical protein